VWRQLADVALLVGENLEAELFEPMKDCFYKDLCERDQNKWITWLKKWRQKLSETGESGEEISKGLRKVSPKFVPREWMLVLAYTTTESGDTTILEELKTVFEKPYDEQDEEISLKYYRKTPAETYEGAGLGGTAFMT